jgi:hypothetical protein
MRRSASTGEEPLESMDPTEAQPHQEPHQQRERSEQRVEGHFVEHELTLQWGGRQRERTAAHVKDRRPGLVDRFSRSACPLRFRPKGARRGVAHVHVAPGVTGPSFDVLEKTGIGTSPSARTPRRSRGRASWRRPRPIWSGVRATRSLWRPRAVNNTSRHREQRHGLDALQLRRRRVHHDDRGDPGRREQLAEANGLSFERRLDGVQDDVAGARIGRREERRATGQTIRRRRGGQSGRHRPSREGQDRRVGQPQHAVSPGRGRGQGAQRFGDARRGEVESSTREDRRERHRRHDQRGHRQTRRRIGATRSPLGAGRSRGR